MHITGATRLDLLLTTLLDTEPEVPVAIGVDGVYRDEAELSFKPLTDPEDPLAELVGFDAPASWDALGIVAPGTARDLITGVRRGRAYVGYLASRGGEAISHLRSTDGVHSGGDPIGRVPDICRRVLGLATTPPDHGSIAAWVQIWLDDVLRTVLEADLDGPSPTWAQIATLSAAGSPECGPCELAIRMATHATEQSWAVMRRRCSEGTLAITGLDPHSAAWMDDGMFSRWACGQYPSVDEIIDDLVVLLEPGVAADLSACCSLLIG